MDFYEFLFTELDQHKRDELIALLNEAGFQGFEEEGPAALRAYVPVEEVDNDQLDHIAGMLEVSFSRTVIKEINWNEKWESSFDPVLILDPVSQTPFASIRANFHPADLRAIYDIIITPKMSFGTGHHATTHLMIQQMSLMDFSGKKVIDFGTGTGVLSILAEKLGAREVLAIDNDEWSIENARENIAANGCSRIEIVKASTISTTFKADYILANINLNIILENLDRLRSVCDTGSIVLLSGILQADSVIIAKALEENQYIIKNCTTLNNWIMLSVSMC